MEDGCANSIIITDYFLYFKIFFFTNVYVKGFYR